MKFGMEEFVRKLLLVLTILRFWHTVVGQQAERNSNNGPFPGLRDEHDIDRLCDRWVICPSGSRCVLRKVQCHDPVCPMKAECQDYSPSSSVNTGICQQSPQSGECTQFSNQWYYNTTSYRCEMFVYSGCGGNDNKFSSIDECRRVCDRSEDICKLRPETGYCKAAFTRWYYDVTTGQCIQFLFGGCLGNKNNFKTLEECQRACLNRTL